MRRRHPLQHHVTMLADGPSHEVKELGGLKRPVLDSTFAAESMRCSLPLLPARYTSWFRRRSCQCGHVAVTAATVAGWLVIGQGSACSKTFFRHRSGANAVMVC